MEIPLTAQVECTDGIYGRSLYILIDPVLDQVTSLVVKRDASPNTEYLERDGDDLHFDVPLDIFAAIAGGEIRIPAVEKPLTLTIPPRTNANQSFRIRSKGMPRLGDVKTRGDLFACIRLVLPDALTDQEVNSISALVSARQKQASPNEVQS